MKEKGKQELTVRALDKALQILEHLSHLTEEIDLATLAREVKIPKSTLLRLLNTLKSHNLVQQNHKSQKYQLGWALIYLGKVAGKYYTLPDIVHPLLEQLAQKTGETATLVILADGYATYMDQLISTNIIKGVPPIGSKLGLYCTSAGKVLLSALSDEELSGYVKTTALEKKTEKTITNPSELMDEIRKVRRQGYAIDDEETEIGGRCVAAPVLDKEGKILAAISIIGPTSRIRKEEFSRLSVLVRETAAQASSALGYVDRG
jgi:IclR family transcriptional regulator, KDG regulon repressor